MFVKATNRRRQPLKCMCVPFSSPLCTHRRPTFDRREESSALSAVQIDEERREDAFDGQRELVEGVHVHRDVMHEANGAENPRGQQFVLGHHVRGNYDPKGGKWSWFRQMTTMEVRDNLPEISGV